MGRGIGKWIEVLTIWMLTCLCFLFLCGSAWAEGTESIVPKHAFAIGLGVSSFDNVEHVLGVEVEIDGLMYEVVGGYTYHNKIMMNVSVDYSTGDLDYNGYIVSFSPPEWDMELKPWKEDADAWILEWRGLIGYDYMFKGKHLLTPFLGIGYRHWNDDGESAHGPDREIEYWYSPIGIRSYGPLSNTWNWGMSLEYDLFWDGEADYDAPNHPGHNLDSGYGARFSLRFSRQLTENVGLSFEPYVTYWEIDETDGEIFTVPGFGLVWGFEPENDTTTYGLRMSVEF